MKRSVFHAFYGATLFVSLFSLPLSLFKKANNLRGDLCRLSLLFLSCFDCGLRDLHMMHKGALKEEDDKTQVGQMQQRGANRANPGRWCKFEAAWSAVPVPVPAHLGIFSFFV